MMSPPAGPPVDAPSPIGDGPGAGTEPTDGTGTGAGTRPRRRAHTGGGPGVARGTRAGAAIETGPGVAVEAGPGVAGEAGPGGGARSTGPRTGAAGTSSESRQGESRQGESRDGASKQGDGSDRGASTLELALLTPILLLVILLVVQFAMVYHARHVALAAAQSGARVAREQSRGDWKAEAESTAREYVQRIGPALLTGVDPQADGDRNQRWVTVTGTAVRVVPFLTFHVSQRSGGPIECYRPDVGAGTTCQDQPQP